MNKTQIQTMVRSALKEHLATNPDVIDLINESRLAFEGMSANIILENAAVNPAIVKNIDNLKSMYLERGAEKVMLFSNGRVHESLNLNTEERKQFRNYNEVRSYAEELKQEGFKPVKNKGAIARFLAKSVRKIAAYIRKYGLITIVGIGIAAALIYFVGPMAVPFLGQIATRLGLSGIMGGGEAVEVGGTGWVEPAVPNMAGEMGGTDYVDPMGGSDGYGSSPVDAYRSANGVGVQGDLNADPMGGFGASAFTDAQVANMSGEITTLNRDIEALPDLIARTATTDPATAASLSSELQSAINQRDYLQTQLATQDDVNAGIAQATAQSQAAAAQAASQAAAQAAAQTAATVSSLEKAMDTYRNLINDPTTSPEVRQNMSDALQRLVAQRNALR